MFVAVVCCGPVRACGRCVRGACVCMLVCVCLCVVGVAGWCVGVRVWLRCDGVGLVAVAWTRVCMYVCVSWLWCLLVRVFVFVCVGVWCCVCCDAVWTLLAAACVDARVLCGLTATDWWLGGGWPAWWRGHWMYSP